MKWTQNPGKHIQTQLFLFKYLIRKANIYSSKESASSNFQATAVSYDSVHLSDKTSII